MMIAMINSLANNYLDKSPPTKKQIDFASAIAKSLGVELPNPQTKQSLFLFIKENRPKFEKHIAFTPTLDDVDIDFDEAECLGIDIYTGGLEDM